MPTTKKQKTKTPVSKRPVKSKPVKKGTVAKNAAKPAPKSGKKTISKPVTKKPTKPAKSAKVEAPITAPAATPDTGKKTLAETVKSLCKPNPVKSTSELVERLQKVGVVAKLAKAPRVFVAILIQAKSNRSVSELFRISSHGEHNVDQVLNKLISRFNGSPVNRAEYAESSLEFLIESELEDQDKAANNLVVPGNKIRFRRKASDSWSTLGDGFHVLIVRNNPYVLDEDAETLATNKRIAKEALATAQRKLTQVGAAAIAATMNLAKDTGAVSKLRYDLIG